MAVTRDEEFEETWRWLCDRWGVKYSDGAVDAMMLATMPFLVRDLVKMLNEDIESIKEDLQRIKPRKSFDSETKELFAKVCQKYYGGQCPICREKKIVEDDRPLSCAQYDHWHANHAIGSQNGLILCDECHKTIDFHNIEQRDQIEPHYKSFQAFVRKHSRKIDKQGKLFAAPK